MQIFLDSANLDEIKYWLSMGLIDGVTTNPSILLKDGAKDMEAAVKAIAKTLAEWMPRCAEDSAGAFIELPLSVEVTTDDLGLMQAQAEIMSQWAKNIVIKIPQITTQSMPCYGVMRNLEKQGIKVNATVAMSLSHVILSEKAEATYISIFAGRVGDEGGDPTQLIRDASNYLSGAYLADIEHNNRSYLIVGSIRSVKDVLDAVKAGADIVTIPPPILKKMCDHQYARETVRQFLNDAKKATGG